MLAECGVGQPLIAGSLVALFLLTSLAIVFVSVAIWRSSSKYPREKWWQGPLAIGAKLCAAISALAAAVSFLVVSYLVFDFIYAGVLPI